MGHPNFEVPDRPTIEIPHEKRRGIDPRMADKLTNVRSQEILRFRISAQNSHMEIGIQHCRIKQGFRWTGRELLGRISARELLNEVFVYEDGRALDCSQWPSAAT